MVDFAKLAEERKKRREAVESLDWKRVVADIETDGLLDTVSVIHSLVVRDLDTDAVLSCTDSATSEWYRGSSVEDGYRRSDLAMGLMVLANAERLYWHNGIGYDFPAMLKILGREPFDPNKLRDTLVIARTRWAHIRERDFDDIRRGKLPGGIAGSHSLKAWGFRLGIHKGNFAVVEDNDTEGKWAKWTPEMQDYCEQDTAVGRALVKYIQKFAPPNEVIETEHELAWDLEQQRRNGFPFNEQRAKELQLDLAQDRELLGRNLRDSFGQLVLRHGKPKVAKRTTKSKDGNPCLTLAGAEYQPVKHEWYNPGSRTHTGRILQLRYGWKPEKFGKDGNPTVDEDTIRSVDFPEKDDLIRYLATQKMMGMLAESKKGLAWLQVCTTDGYQGGRLTGLPHIHHSASNVTVTHRRRHSNPNLGQIPSVEANKAGEILMGYEGRWGADSRDLFGAGYVDGWVQVGADASGLELRCLAHYMARWDNGEYGKVILEGDIHSVNRDALGLDGKPGRDLAKRFIYAYLYGAGDELLGYLLEPNATPERAKKLGRMLKARFVKGLPALKYLMDAVQLATRTKGYVLLPDGRRAYIRHAHAALNTLLQGSGAVICGRWGVETVRRLTKAFGPQGWQNQWVSLAYVHDEFQRGARKEIAEEVAKITVASLESMTEHFKWRIPLAGEYKIGKTWMDTH